MVYDAAAAQYEQHQSDDEQWWQYEVQTVVAAQQFVRRAYQRHTPLCALQWAVKDDVRPAVHLHLHVSRPPVGHRVSQCHDVSAVPGVGVAEDGLLQQLRGVRVYEVVSVGAQHHEVRVFVRVFGGDGLCEFLQRQVRRYHADEPSPLVVQRHTVGSNHLRTGQRPCIEVVEGVHPAVAIHPPRSLVPHLVIIVVLPLAHRGHRVLRRLASLAVLHTYGVGRETIRLVGEVVGFHRDRAAVDVRVVCHDAVRILQQRLLPVVHVDQPQDVARCRLQLQHVPLHAQRRVVEHVRCLVDGLLAYDVARLPVEESQRQREDQYDEEEDVQ